MASPERWKTGPRYRVVTGLTLAGLPVTQTLLSITSHTSALLLASQLGRGASTQSTWLIASLLMFLVPSIATLLTDGVSIAVQPFKCPPWRPVTLNLLLHSAHSLGTILLVFFGLPNLSILQSAAILGNLGTAPACLRLLGLNKNKNASIKTKLADVACSLIQISGLVTWPIVVSSHQPWAIPFGLFLASFGLCLHPLSNLGWDQMDVIKQTVGWTKPQRQFLRSVVALATIAFSSIALASKSAQFEGFQTSDIWLPLLLAGIQICSSYALHWVGVFITDTRTETPGLILPLILSPALSLLPISMISGWCGNFSPFHGVSLHCPEAPTTLEFVFLPIISLLTHATQIWLLRSSLARQNRLFMPPASFLASSHLLHNLIPKPDREAPKGRPVVLGCATMWHETAEEMRALLTSVFKVGLV